MRKSKTYIPLKTCLRKLFNKVNQAIICTEISQNNLLSFENLKETFKIVMKLCRVQCHWDKSYLMVFRTYMTPEQINNFRNYFNLPSLGGLMQKEDKINS